MTGLQFTIGPEASPYLVVALRLLRRRLREGGIPVPADLEELERWALVVQGGLSTLPTLDVGDDRPVPLLLDLADVAAELACSVSTVKRMIADGRLPAVVLAGRRRVHRDDLEQFARQLRAVPMRERVVTKTHPAPPRRPSGPRLAPDAADVDTANGGATSNGGIR